MDSLLLLSKNDIPFIKAQLSIHQPTASEISLIGEEAFFTGVQFLTTTRESAGIPKEYYDRISNLDVILQLGRDRSIGAKFNKSCAEAVLTLMFPEYQVLFLPTQLAIVKTNEDKSEAQPISKEAFDDLQEIIKTMFCLDMLGGGRPLPTYAPANAHAAAIADKIKKGRDKLAQLKSEQNHGQKITILSRYISILAVGERKDMNLLMQYSVYQLFDEFTRFSLKEQSDFYLDAKMAGAKDLQPVDNWMKDVHSINAE